jgi:hypothetical protein
MPPVPFARVAVAFAFLAPAVGSAQGQSDGAATRTVPFLTATRVDARPVIDGRIVEPQWAGAAVATDFTQREPNPGRAAAQRTEARVLYDDEALYVALRMFDAAPDSIVAQLGRRDNEVYSDWAYVGLDSYFDRRTGFIFGINPRGVMMDLLIHNDTEEDPSWDAVWEGAAQRDDAGWSAEFRIPFSQLRFSTERGGDERLWGVNFMRRVARSNETSFWAPTLPSDARMVSLFGELRGLHDLSPPRRLELMPYAVASATRAPGEAGDPFHRATDPFAGVGADVKAGLGSNLTLTATVNPDFGQVEADPSVFNLTASETFFSERRPFFVEGVDIFRFGIGLGDGDLGNESLFYSRRIGRTPQGSVGGDYTSRPDLTTILGAAKLSGKTADGWSVGVLNALTGSEMGRSWSEGVERATPVEPLTNYSVARVIRDFRDGQSAVGVIATATNRALPASGELDWLRGSAYTGGIDGRHRFGDNRYQVRASLVGSRVAGTAEAIDRVQRSSVHYFHRPDLSHVTYDPTRTSLSGYAAKAELFKLQGNVRFALFGMAISSGFEANDLGFQTNADMAVTGYWLGYQNFDAGRWFRSWNVGTNGWGGVNFGGDRLALGGNVNGGFQLNSFWGANAGINWDLPSHATTLLRGGPSFLTPGSWNSWWNVYTDRRKPVRGSFNMNVARVPASGGRRMGFSPSLTVRPSNNAEFSLGPSISWNRNPIQYVGRRTANGRDHWVLGTVDQTTVAMTARVNFTVSPTLSLQVYAQPFVTAGAYEAFKLVRDARADRFDDRVTVLSGSMIRTAPDGEGRRHWVDADGNGTEDFSFRDPGFNFRQLRSNAVLRWEYRPGSALFLVWSQGRTDFEEDRPFDLGSDIGALRSAAGTNVLLLKVSYWFGM